MPTQDPNDFQGNQKSTSSKKIAPGDPMWTTGDEHNQQSFGWGYDYHDPVDYLKGDKVDGGYSSGNSASNFGTVGFEVARLGVEHGNVVDLVINRTDGTAGDIDVVVAIDRDPLGTGVDINTAILGNGRTRVVDGFDVCEVDVDIETLNLNNDDVYFDEVKQELNVKLRAGYRQTRIPMVIAYRTCINHMEPARVHGTLTYRVDEYECKSMVDFGWPSMKFLTEHADCMPDGDDGVLTTKTTNHKLQYQLLSLQVPLKFTVASGSVGAPIEAYTTHLVHAYDKQPGGKDRSYTVGQTYTLESQAIIRAHPWLDPSFTGGSCLGPLNEVHQTTTYDLTAGVYQVTFPTGSVFNFEQMTNYGQLTAALGSDATVTSVGGTPLMNSDPLSSNAVLIEWNGPTYAGKNVADLIMDDTNANPDGTPAGGQELTVSTLRDGRVGNLDSTLCMCLTSLSAANGSEQNYGASVIVNKTGSFKDHDSSTFDPGTGKVIHSHVSKTETLPVGTEPSQWQSHKLVTIGDQPDLTDGVPELAPGDATATPPVVGESDIRVNPLDNYIYGYADPTGNYGDTIDYLFDGPGFPTGWSIDKHFTMTNDAPDASTLRNFPQGGDLTNWTTSETLSNAGYFWMLGNAQKANQGPSLVNDWVVNSNDPNSTAVLYSLTALDINQDNYTVNKQRLNGYYMTCNDHQSKKLFLKIYPKDADANFSMANLTQIEIDIDKTSRYDGLKHAAYDLDQSSVSLIMHHLSGKGKSYRDNDEIGHPTGESMMKRLFANGSTDFPDYAPLDPTTGLATDFGPLSSNDIMFLSLVEGYKASDAISKGATNPFRGPPVFSITEPRPIRRTIANNGVRTFSITATNTGEADLILNYENQVEDVVGYPTTPPFTYNTSETTAQRVGVSNQWILEQDEIVVTTYTLEPTTVGTINFTHQIQADYIGFPPGVEVEDIDFTITVT